MYFIYVLTTKKLSKYNKIGLHFFRQKDKDSKDDKKVEKDDKLSKG